MHRPLHSKQQGSTAPVFKHSVQHNNVSPLIKCVLVFCYHILSL